MATSKSMFLTKALESVDKMAQLADSVDNLISVYTSREYGSTDPITNEDLANIGSNLTAEEFNTLVAPLFVAFLGFSEPNNATLDKARRDI